MQTETDGQLVTRSRQGEVAAFEQIVRRYRAPLVALAAARLGSRADAEDVVQEALVQAFFQLHRLRDPAALLPWLRRITERQALMWLRRRREEPVAPEQLESVPQADSGESLADELLQQLPLAMRRTLALTYLAGYSCAEAAQLLGVQEGTVKSRLSRARVILREAFEMAQKDLSKGKSEEEFTQETVERILQEARRLLEEGDFEGAGQRANRVIGMQVKQLFALGDDPSFVFNSEAVYIQGLAHKERRRKECEANATLYGYRLEELDWQVADIEVLSGTLGKPTGYGKDIWGVPHSRMKLKIMDARDICRRLNCSPISLHNWVEQGCPILRCWPFARYDLDRVKQWLADNQITDWPKESDRDLDRPIRVIFRELHNGNIDPEQAEKIVTELGWGVWE